MGKWEISLGRAACGEHNVIAMRREGCHSKIHMELSVLSSLPVFLLTVTLILH